MANPVWPSTLPAPLDESGDYSPAFDNIIKSNVEQGPSKRRRRATYAPEVFTGSVLLDSAQCATLIAFYEQVLAFVGPFDWVDFRTNQTITYVFNSRPKFSRVPGSGVLNRWKASLELLTR